MLPEKLVHFVGSVCLRGHFSLPVQKGRGPIENEGETCHAG